MFYHSDLIVMIQCYDIILKGLDTFAIALTHKNVTHGYPELCQHVSVPIIIHHALKIMHISLYFLQEAALAKSPSAELYRCTVSAG